MSDDVRQHGGTVLRIALFGAIAVLIAMDLISDYGDGAGLWHIVLELTVLGLAAAGALAGWQRLARTRAELARLDADLARARRQAERWRAENESLVKGLAAAIEAQFNEWALSRAEAEVGLLLLKGLSLLGQALWLEGSAERAGHELRAALYRHLLALPLAEHRQRARGELLARLFDDAEHVKAATVAALVASLRDGLAALALLAVAVTLAPRLALSRAP